MATPPELPQVALARERDKAARERLAATGNDPVPSKQTITWPEAVARYEFSQRGRRPA